MFSQARHQFLDTSRENLILWIFYFGIQQLCTYFPVYLTSQPPFACLHPRHLLHLYPFPSLTTSHLLDLIEFFPEEEMFPPNESVEILHSDKHDPIFRLIKESFSLSFLLAFVAPFRGRARTVLSSLSLFSFHDFRLYLKCFPMKHARYSYTCHIRVKGLVSVWKLWELRVQFLQTLQFN